MSYSTNKLPEHAFLSPSKYHWLNYSDDKLVDVYLKHKASLMGTALHEFASKAIKLGIKLTNDGTLGMFINDCIDFKMLSEEKLFYSVLAFGTADALKFDNNILYIFDLKTGTTKSSIKQLYIYAALYCLEYNIKPKNIEFVLRLYQNNGITEDTPEYTIIQEVMNKIVYFDKLLSDIKWEDL